MERLSSLIACVVAVVLVGCAAHRQQALTSAVSSFRCPVTIPNGSHAPGEFTDDSTLSPTSHGNGKIWTNLPIDGKLEITPDADGTIGQKFPWWKVVPDHLTVTGRRLDGPAAPLRAWIPSGYGERFQSTGLYFPTDGCWEITGKADDAQLTFVLDVTIQKRSANGRYPLHTR
jgi:hypothetical protein